MSSHGVSQNKDQDKTNALTRHQKLLALQNEPETMDRLVDLVEGGKSINQIASEWGVRPSRLRAWVYDDSDNKRRYDDARKALADTLVHEALATAKGGVGADGEKNSDARDRLIAEVNLKVAGKLDSQYSDKAMPVNVNISNSSIDFSLGDSAASLLAKIRSTPKTIEGEVIDP